MLLEVPGDFAAQNSRENGHRPSSDTLAATAEKKACRRDEMVAASSYMLLLSALGVAAQVCITRARSVTGHGCPLWEAGHRTDRCAAMALGTHTHTMSQ